MSVRATRWGRADDSVQRQMHEYLEGLLRHKSDMVNIEAARAICEMRTVSTAELFRPVAGELRLTISASTAHVQFCSSSSLRQRPFSSSRLSRR